MLLVLLMAVSIITACTSKKDSGGIAGGTTASKIEAGGESKIDPETYIYEKQIEIKIPIYDRGVQGQAPVDNNYWTRWIQKEFGDKHNIKVTYVPIPRSSDVDKFNMLLATNDAPDIIFSYDFPIAMSFYSRGAFMELNQEMLNTYAPNFLKWSGDTMKYGVIDGKQIFLAATRPEAYNWVTLIREDWLEKAGLKMPQSLTEYENALMKFKELKLGGEKTIPATLSLPSAYFGAYAYRPFPMPEEELALYSDINVAALSWEPVRKALKDLNRLFNKGLLSPEFALDKDGKQAQADFMNGRAGVYGFYLSKTPPVIQTLMQNAPDAKLAVLHPMAGVPEGGYPASRAYWPFGMLSGINKSCKNPEAVLIFFNWMSKPDVLFTLQNGIKGVTYDLVDGLPVLKEYKGEERLNYNSNKDIWCLVTEGKYFDSIEKALKVQETTYAPEGFEYLIRQSYEYTEQYRKYQYPDFLFDRTISSLAKYQQTLLTKWQEIYVELVMCKPEEFDAKYEQAKKEYLESGFQEILDEKLAIYKEMKNK